MATEEFKGMVLLDGVRWRLNDLERVHPDRVKEAKKITEDIADVNVTTTVPGGLVTGEDALGGKIISTEDTAAGNTPVPDTKHEGTGDGTTGGSDGTGDGGTEKSSRSTSGTSSKKSK